MNSVDRRTPSLDPAHSARLMRRATYASISVAIMLILAKTVAWVVVVIIAATLYEIVMRYVFNAPTDWVFEFNYLIHGPYFLLLGAYTFAIKTSGVKWSYTNNTSIS